MSKIPTKSRNAQKVANPSTTLDAAPKPGDRVLNVQPDVSDLRDRIYGPALRDLDLQMDPPDPQFSPICDQGREVSCTGFALASAITLMNRRRHHKIDPTTVVPMTSPRMLYEMAKIHDEWPGEDYKESSIRGALKGFYNNGACSEDVTPYKDGQKNWFLKVKHAKDARNVGLGAYYRLRPEIVDYHALNEADSICSIRANLSRLAKPGQRRNQTLSHDRRRARPPSPTAKHLAGSTMIKRP